MCEPNIVVVRHESCPYTNIWHLKSLGLLDHSYCKLGDDVFIFICRYFIIGPLGIFNIIKIYYYHLISHVSFMCDNCVIR